MSKWAESLEKAKAGTATKAELIDTLTHWMGTDIAASTEGMYEAVSRRVVWLFPDLYAFAIGTNFNPVIYHLSELQSPDSLPPLPTLLQKEWHYAPQANGWQYYGGGNEFIKPEDALVFINALTETHGTPRLILPWEYSWTDSVTDQGEEYYTDWYEDEETEDNIRETMYNMVVALTNKELDTVSPWELIITSEDDGLSEYSDFTKFMKLVGEIEERKLAILDLDQHCAGCSSGTYEHAVKADPELEGKPIFRTWSQNSEWLWRGDGSIYVDDVYLDNPEVEKEIKMLAIKIGLEIEFDPEDWEPTGNFEYES